MPFSCYEATLADIPAITSIFAHDEPPPFMKLCLGSTNAIALNVKQADNITQGLQNPEEKWLVARDEHNKTASFAQWQLPKDETEDVEMQEELAAETYRESITLGMNTDLVVEFRYCVTKLRQSVLRGRKYYLLMNVGTAMSWQHKGAATVLVKWPFAAADQEKMPVYLDTSSDGPGIKLFEKLGFEKVGSFDIDLSGYGGQGNHTHVGMIRWPTQRSQCNS